MKKLFLSILLLCCCVVFTGCGGNSNSYDGAYKITVSKNIINDETVSSSRAATSGTKDIELFLNGVEFPGQSFDSDQNYVFTKVMYEQDAHKVLSGASTTVSIFSVDGEKRKEILSIVFQRVTSLGEGLFIKKTGGSYIVINGTTQKEVIQVNGENLVDLDEITGVEISKLSSLSAKVTFRNILKESKKLDFDSWKISALDSNLEEIHSWTSEKDSSDKKLEISFVNDITEKYYTINLTSSGITSANGHNLDNTIVKIDNIRKDGHDVVDTGILEQATWYPNK